ncbi:hypothetical protein GIB67_029633 [Kingdonia uniflora]|uniref:R13L1/DRL21-like LRR repeat region domain-containing protein n=1 Tax=Kingdonia uniflora TaxID=39325 RepID=A0A7J7LLT8_9MAGN|nr:hypothetical protein GIB67_029633 [Kingdonia uniflora]
MGGFSQKQISFPFSNNENRGVFRVQQHLLALHELEIVGWSMLTSLPNGLQCLTTLEKLTISHFSKLQVLPEWFRRLSSLQFLMIGECKKLTSMPSKEKMGRLTKLRRLKICCCPLLKIMCLKDCGSEWHNISHIPYIKIDDEKV